MKILSTKLRKLIGIFLVLLGIFLHLIPLFPAGWIIIIGLELLGVRLIFWDKIKAWFLKHPKMN